jgi:lipopolysaccharide biosynthesis glycosyltransferase
VLNAVCVGDVKLLDKNWNMLNFRYFREDNTPIRIIHYAGPRRKPWDSCSSKWDELGWRVAERTDFLRDIVTEKRSAIIGEMILRYLCRLRAVIAGEESCLFEKSRWRKVREHLKIMNPMGFHAYRCLRDVTARLFRCRRRGR